MAQESGKPKFPAPLPNLALGPAPTAAPAHPPAPAPAPAPKKSAELVTANLDLDFESKEERTDPNLAMPARATTGAPAPAAAPARPRVVGAGEMSRPAPGTLPPRAAAPAAGANPFTVAPPTGVPSATSARVAAAAAPAAAAPNQPSGAPRPLAKMPDLGAIDAFMKDPAVSEIMVNDLRNVMLEKEGKLTFSGYAYQGIDELNRLVRTILDATGRILSPDMPYVDVMLPDGSRVNIVGPPLTVGGPSITIRKFPAKHLGINDLLASEMMDQRMAYFLNVCVVGRLNILVCGGTGSGKTTLLNVLAGMIPRGERLVTIEDTPELAIEHFNSVRLQTKPQTPASAPVTARDLVANALRMRPDRIIVGECRRSEAFDMLQAMNTGHDGSMTTLHANSPRDGLARVETLCMMSGIELPVQAIRKQITGAIDLIVQVKRFRNGKRRITAISELTGMESETYTLQDIFLYEVDTKGVGGTAGHGEFKVSGLVPTFVERLREQGIELPRNYFG